MLRAFLRTLFAWRRLRGRRLGLADGQIGSVTFLQRFGGILNLNPHVHCLLPDGLFVPGTAQRLVFAPLPPPTDEDITYLTARLASRLSAIARCRLEQDEESGYNGSTTTMPSRTPPPQRPCACREPLGKASPLNEAVLLGICVGLLSLFASATEAQTINDLGLRVKEVVAGLSQPTTCSSSAPRRYPRPPKGQWAGETGCERAAAAKRRVGSGRG